MRIWSDSFEHRGAIPAEFAMGNRRLALQALSFLMTLEDEEIFTICSEYQQNARNMTEEFGGMVLLTDSVSPRKDDALTRFYNRWKDDPVVSCSWFSAQALSSQPDTIERCRRIEKDPAFALSNPSKALALYRTLANKQICFNAPDGSGYQFIAEAA